MKIIQINSSINSGSTGRISEEIGIVAQKSGYEVYAAYGRLNNNSKLKTIKIGSDLDIYIHGIKSRLFDNHGFASKNATRKFISELEIIKPDIIHLHNIHGYYLNVEILFNYIRKNEIPVIWTLHDCWPMTGHCSYFDFVNCNKWQTHCNNCPNKKGYPQSYGLDASKQNFDKKKSLFTGLKNVTIVTPSLWLAEIVKCSYLSRYPVRVINNGVDLTIFRPNETAEIDKKYNLTNKKVIFGVASIWDRRKGLDDFIQIHEKLANNFQIVLVGLSTKQIEQLPKGIIAILRTEDINELAELYSRADVFVNPTYVDNFPTTNIEALACGTPVVSYITGGSTESITVDTGITVPKGNIDILIDAIWKICMIDKKIIGDLCRKRAEKYYNKDDRYTDYIQLYNDTLKLQE